MASWRLAKSLAKLEAEIKAAYPGTTVWDIGDEDHQAGYSDHNPNAKDVVCAIDVFGDGGMNLAKFVAHLIENPHSNLRYVIFDEKIYQRKNDFAEQDYNGPNKHKKHAHVSVGNGPDGRSTSSYDSTATWDIDELGKKPSKPSTPSKPPKPSTPSTGKLGDKMPTIQRGNKGSRVRILQGLLVAWHYKIAVDGVFGKNTDAAVRDFQRKYAKPVDGKVGPITWSALLDL